MMENPAEAMLTPQEGFTPEEEAWFASHPEAVAKKMQQAYKAAQNGKTWEELKQELQ